MATIYNANKPDEEKEAEALGSPVVKSAGGVSGVPAQSSVGLVAPATGAAPGAGAPSPAKRPGTGFIGVQQYLDANKQAGANLAGQVGQTMQAAGETARKAVADEGSKFSKAVSESTVQFDKDLFDRAGGDLLGLSDEDKAKIRSQATATYQGPKEFEGSEGFAGIRSAIGKAKEQATALGSEAGRKALLQEQAKGPYTAGQGSFDQLLLGGQGQKLGAARQAATAGLESGLGETTAQQNAAATQAAAATKAAQEQATERIGGIRTGFEAGIDQRVKDEQTRITNTQNQLQTRLTDALSGGADLSPAEMRGMGIAPEVWVKIRDGVIKNAKEMEGQGYQTKDFVKNWVAENLGGYLGKQDAGLVSRGTVATAEDTARQAALRDILGDQGYTAFTQTGEGGQAAAAPLDVNEEALFSDILAAQRGDFKTTHREALGKAKKEREAEAERKAEEARKKQLSSAFGTNTGGLRF